jgi:hypothetical protein
MSEKCPTDDIGVCVGFHTHSFFKKRHAAANKSSDMNNLSPQGIEISRINAGHPHFRKPITTTTIQMTVSAMIEGHHKVPTRGFRKNGLG